MVAGVFGKGHAKALTSWKGSIASARIKPVASKLNEANELEILGEIHRQGGCLGKEIQKPKRKNFIHTYTPTWSKTYDLAVAEICLGMMEVPTVHPHVSGRKD